MSNEDIAHFREPVEDIVEYLYFYLKHFNFETMGSISSIATAVNSKIIKAMTIVILEKSDLVTFHQFAKPIVAKIK